MTKQLNNYDEYLKSAEWKARRETALAKAKYTCDQCGARASQVHHTSYDNLGNEKDSDLTVLCGKCHMKHHRIEIPPLCDWALQLDPPSMTGKATQRLIPISILSSILSSTVAWQKRFKLRLELPLSCPN